MAKDYSAEIKDLAKEYGYKAANLQYLQGLVREFSTDRTDGISIDVPAIMPLKSTDILAHLDSHAAGWRDLWDEFCTKQGENDTITAEAEAVLTQLQDKIKTAFTENLMSVEGIDTDTLSMVRSTSNEDRVDVANPGGNESVPSKTEDISASIGTVVASYFTAKSFNQRLKSKENITAELPLTACLIQKMIGEGLEKDNGSVPISGVVYTDEGHIRIQAAPGHGELVVNSEGNFDSYYIDSDDLVFSEVRDKRFRLVPQYDEEKKKMKLISQDNGFTTATESGMSETTLLAIADFSRFIEEKYGMRMDIEFVYDSARKTINIVQARPIPDGDRRGLKPSALSPEFIAEHNPVTLKANVITPDILSAVIIKDRSEVLVCNTIEEALNIYLTSRTDTIKAVVIATEAADTSHPAGMFTSKAIPVMHIADLGEVEAMLDKLPTDPMVIDPQHNALYSSPAITVDSIKEGLFKSTLSPHVTPAKRDESIAEERYAGALDLLKSNRHAEPYEKLSDLTGDLDKLAMPKFGEGQEENKQRLAHMLSMATKAADQGKITKPLFQELMLAANEMVNLLDRISMTGSYDEKLFKHYLDIYQKFSGELITQAKKDTLSSSLIRDVASYKHEEANKKLIAEHGLEAGQKDVFLELIKLKKYFINADDGEKWQEFCLESCKSKPKCLILRNLVKELTQLGVHEYWLNTQFLEKYEASKDHALRELYSEFDAGRESRGKLLESGRIVDQIEHQITLWADPNNFSKLHSELQENLRKLDGLLTIDKSNPLNAQMAFMQLNRLIDSFDKSIKALQTSHLYGDKTQQVQNFKYMLQDFMGLMEKWVDQEKVLRKGSGERGVIPVTHVIRSKFEELTSTNEGQLLPSAGFSVLETSIYQEKELGFSRGMEHIKSLADFHTLIHQNLLTSVQYHSRELSPILRRVLPTKLTSLMEAIETTPTSNIVPVKVAFSMSKLEMISIDINYPSVKILYNMPLRNHSAIVECDYNYKNNQTTLHYHFVGYEPERWKLLQDKAIKLINGFGAGEIIESKLTDNSVDIQIKLPKDPEDARIVIDIMNLMGQNTIGNVSETSEILRDERVDFPLWSCVLKESGDLPEILSKARHLGDVQWALSRMGSSKMGWALSKMDNIDELIEFLYFQTKAPSGNKEEEINLLQLLIKDYGHKINFENLLNKAVEKSEIDLVGMLRKPKDKVLNPDIIAKIDKLYLSYLDYSIKNSYIDTSFFYTHIQALYEVIDRNKDEVKTMLKGEDAFIFRLINVSGRTLLSEKIKEISNELREEEKLSILSLLKGALRGDSDAMTAIERISKTKLFEEMLNSHKEEIIEVVKEKHVGIERLLELGLADLLMESGELNPFQEKIDKYILDLFKRAVRDDISAQGLVEKISNTKSFKEAINSHGEELMEFTKGSLDYKNTALTFAPPGFLFDELCRVLFVLKPIGAPEAALSESKEPATELSDAEAKPASPASMSISDADSLSARPESLASMSTGDEDRPSVRSESSASIYAEGASSDEESSVDHSVAAPTPSEIKDTKKELSEEDAAKILQKAYRNKRKLGSAYDTSSPTSQSTSSTGISIDDASPIDRLSPASAAEVEAIKRIISSSSLSHSSAESGSVSAPPALAKPKARRQRRRR